MCTTFVYSINAMIRGVTFLNTTAISGVLSFFLMPNKYFIMSRIQICYFSAVDYINYDLQCFVDPLVNLVFNIRSLQNYMHNSFFLKKNEIKSMVALHAIVNVLLAYMKYLSMSSQTKQKEINAVREKKSI